MDRAYLVSKTKVSSTRNPELRHSLDEFFNNPKNYFQEDYLRQRSTSPKFAFTMFPNDSPKNDGICYSVRKSHFTNMPGRKKTIINIPKENNKQLMTVQEVDSMFSNILQRQNQPDFQEVFKKLPYNKYLQSQAHAITLRKIHHNRYLTVLRNLALKSHRRKEDLVMNTSNDNRIKNEAKIYMNKYNTKMNYWTDSLRQPNVATHEKVDTKQFLINRGTRNFPIWQMTSLDSQILNVVNPSIKEETLNESTLGFDFLTQNSLDHSDLTKVIDKSEKLKQLCVQGKSLFKVEYDNFKSMKGNKFYNVAISKEPSDEIIIHQSKNSNYHHSNSNSFANTGKLIVTNKESCDSTFRTKTNNRD